MTPTSNPEIADLHRDADAPLTGLLESLPAGAWDAPTPCAGWTAHDVVDHMVNAQRSFLSGHGHDLGPAPDLSVDPAAGWKEHTGRVAALLADPAVTAQAFEGHFGPTTVGEAFGQFYVFDMVAHRWDLARAAGCDERFTPAELDTMETAIAGWGDALYMEGICEAGVEAPAGADRQTRLLATLGRTA
ncbi:MAG: TIGR03086 family metal-binding protein [Iamia sp.]